MKINRQNDHYFLHLLNTKVLIVSKEGIISNTLTGKQCVHKGKHNTYQRIMYKGKSIQAHRIVWMAFNGLIPKDLQINHKNGIKSDNRLVNLEIVTNSQNTQHAFDTGLNIITKSARRKSSERLIGEKNINAKLTDSKVIQIRQQFDENAITKKEIQQKYNISRRTVENMLLGRSYKHLPFKLENLRKDKYYKEKDSIKNLYASGDYTQQQIADMFNTTRNKIKYMLST